MKRPTETELPTDKDGKILHDFMFLMNRSRGYLIPANIELEFQAWADTGRADDRHDEFDDFRVVPPGAITKLIFLSPRSVN
jgi:hypothetical protein